MPDETVRGRRVQLEGRLRELLESRLLLGRDDHRWDSYSAARLVREAQEELLDAVLYLEKLSEKLEGRDE